MKIVKVIEDRVFDWEKVTALYNFIKDQIPFDWWVIADIDEFHLYPDDDIVSLTQIYSRKVRHIKTEKNIDIVYIKSIMRNYKFNLIQQNIFIDLYKFQNILLNYKNDQYTLDIYKLYHLELSLIKFFPERYTGIILKFKTPIPDNDNKLTTVKIFSSGKINIDGGNSIEEIYLRLSQ